MDCCIVSLDALEVDIDVVLERRAMGSGTNKQRHGLHPPGEAGRVLVGFPCNCGDLEFVECGHGFSLVGVLVLITISRMRALELLGVCAMLFGRRGNAAKREQCFWLRGEMSFGAVLGAAHGSRCGAARGCEFVKSRR